MSTISQPGCSTSVALATGPTEEQYLLSEYTNCTWYICKGCQGGYQDLDKQETQGALEVERQAKGFLKKETLCKNLKLVKAQPEQKPAKNIDGVGNRTLLLKTTPI